MTHQEETLPICNLRSPLIASFDHCVGPEASMYLMSLLDFQLGL